MYRAEDDNEHEGQTLQTLIHILLFFSVGRAMEPVETTIAQSIERRQGCRRGRTTTWLRATTYLYDLYGREAGIQLEAFELYALQQKRWNTVRTHWHVDAEGAWNIWGRQIV